MVFILGAIVGIVLMLIVFAPKLLSGSGKARGGILMLERPGDRFDARSFKVFHVIKEGALANAAENDGSDGVMYSGTTVLFPAGGVNLLRRADHHRPRGEDRDAGRDIPL